MTAVTTRRVQLDREAVADRLGVTPETVTRYRSADRAGLYAFPAPDGYIGRSPWWWSTSIDRWVRKRPGRGAGGGRPSTSRRR